MLTFTLQVLIFIAKYSQEIFIGYALKNTRQGELNTKNVKIMESIIYFVI